MPSEEKKKEFVNIDDFEANNQTYRITFNCQRCDYDDIIDRIENYAAIEKEEVEQYVE